MRYTTLNSTSEAADRWCLVATGEKAELTFGNDDQRVRLTLVRDVLKKTKEIKYTSTPLPPKIYVCVCVLMILAPPVFQFTLIP